jgi:hypothetical protein
VHEAAETNHVLDTPPYWLSEIAVCSAHNATMAHADDVHVTNGDDQCSHGFNCAAECAIARAGGFESVVVDALIDDASKAGPTGHHVRRPSSAPRLARRSGTPTGASSLMNLGSPPVCVRTTAPW